MEPKVIRKQIMRRGVAWNHHFCNFCGRELTKINLEKGFITQECHRLLTYDDGVQLRRCWNTKKCDERRKINEWEKLSDSHQF